MDEDREISPFLTRRAAEVLLTSVASTIQEMDPFAVDVGFDFAKELDRKLARLDEAPEDGMLGISAQEKGDLAFLRQRLKEKVGDARCLGQISKDLTQEDTL